MITHLYPYQDTITANLPGERWRFIPDFEGYYMASSKGRIKSVDRVIPHPRLHQQFVKGRILTQKVVEDKNSKIGDSIVSLQVCVSYEGRQKYRGDRGEIPLGKIYDVE